MTFTILAATCGSVWSRPRPVRSARPVDEVLLYCFHYDPASGKYSASVEFCACRGVLTIVLLVAMVWYLLKKEPPTGSPTCRQWFPAGNCITCAGY